MSGINIHGLIRGVITSIHADEEITLYMNNGQVNEYGVIRPSYAPPVTVKAQVQIDDPGSLEHRNHLDMNTRSIRAYLYSLDNATLSSLRRLSNKSADFLKRQDGTWWIVVSMIDDFADCGWISIRAVQTMNGPETGDS